MRITLSLLFAASSGAVAAFTPSSSSRAVYRPTSTSIPMTDVMQYAPSEGDGDIVTEFANIPQKSYVYPASDRAKELLKKPTTIAMDTLFSGVYPIQWKTTGASEQFHEEMDRLKAAGFKTIAGCPSADALDASLATTLKAVQWWLKQIHDRPESYKIIRTAADIDTAMAEDKLGIYFTHQGTSLFQGNPDSVPMWRQLGYGYCLLAYNSRNTVGDGCYEGDNGHLTTFGKILVDAYNKYGMLIDVSHTGENTALGAIERSRDPVISSHSGAKGVFDYPRGHSDAVIKAIGESGGVMSINCVGGFVDPENPDIVSTDILFKHIDYIVNMIGIDHVGFGSDYIPEITYTAVQGQGPLSDVLFPDGKGIFRKMCAKGVPTPAPYDVLPALVDKMFENGYTEEDCAKVVGGNSYRVYKQVWHDV